MNTVAKRQEPQAPAEQSETTAIISMIERLAVSPNVNIETVERLLAMQEKVVADRRRTAYMAALADMQTELPEIEKRGQIKIGQGNKPQMYALWEDINEAIKPVLHKFGFALSFRTGQSDGKFAVTGILSHNDGHAEETTMALPIDTSGSKNAVQAVGSSLSYGKRYTAAALLNLTSRGEDDDGAAAGAGETISDAQLQRLITLLDEVGGDKIKFCNRMKVPSLAEIPAKRFGEALAVIEAKRAK